MSGTMRRWVDAHPYWVLAGLTVAMLGPFLAKPFNIDDPLFLWSAKHILAHPLDPYGFKVAWDWTEMPLFKVTENPPLACYYLALAGAVFGWGEIGLHLAFLPPAIAVVCGTYRLAKHFCPNPLLAAGLLFGAPIFWISATSVMCDVLMLAGWIWALVYWVEGTAQNSARKMFLAGTFIALAALTKYFGACLIPLLAAYSLALRRPLRQWGPALLIGLATLWAYQGWSQIMYGRSLLFQAADYAVFSKQLFGLTKVQDALVALTFIGGSVPAVILLAPAWMNRRTLVVFLLGFLLAAAVLSSSAMQWGKYGELQGGQLVSAGMQMGVWLVGGLTALALMATELIRRRAATTLLLALWILGVFWFAAFCNWTVNGRSVLPIIPAVVILIARQLPGTGRMRAGFIAAAMGLCVVLTLMVVRGDYLKAAAVRESTLQVQRGFPAAPGTLWYEGHWGFQYYMESIGGRALDFTHPQLRPGDLVALPEGNTNVRLLEEKYTELLGTCHVPDPAKVTTMNGALGAGFYAAVVGPLPYAFGAVPPEGVAIYRLK